MDVSTRGSTTHSRVPIYREISCDACGYPRTGLPDGLFCPECGGSAPKVLPAARSRPWPITQGNHAWLTRISAGLIVLALSYLTAFQVIVSMPVGRYIAPSVNVLAPKIASTALILRSIGNKAGPVGISGVVAVLASVLAVWILTEPRTPRNSEPLARLLRWTTIITVGGIFGLTLTWNQLGPESHRMRIVMIAALLGCDLPVNILLYLHLRYIALQLDLTRAAETLRWCGYAAALLILGSAGMVVIIPAVTDENVWLVDIASVLHGAMSLVCGLTATIAIGQLIIASSAAALGQFAAKATRQLLRIPVAVKMLAVAIQRDSSRASIILGVGLWLCTLPWTVAESLWFAARQSTGGDMPYINFLAPKVAIASVALGRWDEMYPYGVSHDVLIPLLLQSLAIWLMTRGGKRGGDSPWLRRTTRLAAIVTTGAALGWSLWLPARWENGLYELRRAQVLIALTLLAEMPVTVLLYWNLAAIARRFDLPRLSIRLRRLAIAVGMLITLPLGFFVLASLSIAPHKVTIAVASASLIMAAELGVGLLALAAIAELAWNLLINPYQSGSASLSSPQDDPSIANTSAA